MDFKYATDTFSKKKEPEKEVINKLTSWEDGHYVFRAENGKTYISHDGVRWFEKVE